MYLCKGVPRVEKGEFVPLQTLDVLDHEGEVSHRLQAQLRLQRVQHVLREFQHHEDYNEGKVHRKKRKKKQTNVCFALTPTYVQ